MRLDECLRAASDVACRACRRSATLDLCERGDGGGRGYVQLPVHAAAEVSAMQDMGSVNKLNERLQR
jgi:hypothetical protein